ncbi:MAG: TVP38/TMEM64 family protein [Nitrospirae bacterium]|nr:MAG: TVP38/TMEM64 family protein [Nitrospirota bacterium]
MSFFLNKERMTAFLNSLGPLSFVGFIILQAAQVIVSPIPGEVTGIIGGYLYGKFFGVMISTIGLTLGSLAAFSLSRVFGRPFVDKFISKATLDKYDYLLHHKGAFLVFLLFLVPGFPKDILCYILGLGHLTTKEFFIISTVGRLGGTVLLTFGGDYIHHQQYYRFFALIGFAIIIVFLSMVYRDKLERLFKKLHRSHEGKDRK